jgi:hypothetical protein
MGNRGWDQQAAGGGWASNARTTGRMHDGSDDADPFVKGSRIGHPGGDNDPLDGPDDLFEPPGQLSTTSG